MSNFLRDRLRETLGVWVSRRWSERNRVLIQRALEGDAQALDLCRDAERAAEAGRERDRRALSGGP